MSHLFPEPSLGAAGSQRRMLLKFITDSQVMLRSGGENHRTDLLVLVFLPLLSPCEARGIPAAQAFLRCRVIFACLLMLRFLPARFQVRSQRTWSSPPLACAFISPTHFLPASSRDLSPLAFPQRAAGEQSLPRLPGPSPPSLASPRYPVPRPGYLSMPAIQISTGSLPAQGSG